MENKDQFKKTGLWCDVKTETGFVLNVNLRGDTLEECFTELKTFIQDHKMLPYERYARKESGNTFFKKEAKPKEYTGEDCPQDGGKLIFTETKKGRAVKCENSNWDFKTKQETGCNYFKFVS